MVVVVQGLSFLILLDLLHEDTAQLVGQSFAAGAGSPLGTGHKTGDCFPEEEPDSLMAAGPLGLSPLARRRLQAGARVMLALATFTPPTKSDRGLFSEALSFQDHRQ